MALDAKGQALIDQLLKRTGLPSVADARRLCRNNLAFLCREVLGYRDLGQFHINPKTGVIPLYHYAEKKSRLILIELPRGHFKSTIFVNADTIRRLLRNQDMAIGLFSWGMKTSQRNLAVISRQMRDNRLLNALFPDIFWGNNPKAFGAIWSNKEIEVKRENFARGEASVTACSIESLPTGFHFDYIKVDDLVTQDNATPELIRKTSERFALLPPLLVDPEKNPIDVVGTRYAYGDKYGELEMDEEWWMIKRAAEDIHGNPTFPERFTKHGLAKLKVGMGSWWYATQYLLEPVPPDLMTFDMKFFRTMKKLPAPELGVISVDPAPAPDISKSGSDPNVIMFVGVRDGRAYVYEVIRRPMGLHERVEAIVSMVKKYHHKLIGLVIEVIGAQRDMVVPLEIALARENCLLPIEWVKGYKRGEGKVERIRNTVGPLLESNKIVLKEELKCYDENGRVINVTEIFKREFEQFPAGVTDDLVDALSAALKHLKDYLHDAEVEKNAQEFDNSMNAESIYQKILKKELDKECETDSLYVCS